MACGGDTDTTVANAAATTEQIPVKADQGNMTFAESRIKLLMCDAPEGLGAPDNCLERSHSPPLPGNRLLGNKVCYLPRQKPC